MAWLEGLLGRCRTALKLRCPVCTKGKPFVGLLTVKDHCEVCAYRFEREQGYFIGSIYFNYGATVAIEVSGYFACEYFFELKFIQQVPIWVTFSITFPFWFLRYARSLWMALDLLVAPPEEDDFVVRRETDAASIPPRS